MIIFKKKHLFGFISILALSFLLAACGGGGEEPEETEGDTGGEGTAEGESSIEAQTWRFVTEEVQGQVQYEYAAEFAKRMDEKSGGKITIEPYEYGGLGSESDQVELLQNGGVEMAVMSPGFTGNMVMEGQIFSLQFLFPDSVKKTQEILNTSEALNKDLAAKYEEKSIKPLAFWTEGGTQWTSNKPLKTPADFEDFLMRTQTSPLQKKSYEAYGAEPTAMSWSELYTALDRGTVEGQENPIFFIGDASFNEVQDYMTISNHNNYVAMTTVNNDWYNGLSDEVKSMIDETVTEMQDWVFKEQKKQNDKYLQIIKEDTENPTEVIELTEEQRQAFKEKALPVRDFYREEVSTVNGEILDKLEEEIKAATE
ncbi:DctP family TRAP transporter solute-binding subunit [Aquibacillus sp. 3ASR75-11]|uniref:DctP family TRAP transporter solute-binding subunit n=1 Tax=Terrihalobacillus insolitus TaxID=2950438 RepID=A0A9X3WTN2_9BACI|nr:DctP family TRAP transporter solute-binding subunit [Terrihalobacillus insolitus]MDC3414582.1 DctP family TRAP transporter solute-binding subunit [Terrihalobacillus insolitus]MDC3425742.1 DctP family TRAP transporter solute-binding subunit [Terrihalobacillus insolitus]